MTRWLYSLCLCCLSLSDLSAGDSGWFANHIRPLPMIPVLSEGRIGILWPLLVLLLTGWLHHRWQARVRDRAVAAAVRHWKEAIREKEAAAEALLQRCIRLDLLNKKLVDEMAEREHMERAPFHPEQVLATLSHELRTPLNIVLGLSDQLLTETLPAAQAEQVHAIRRAGRELATFVASALSNLTGGKWQAGAVSEGRPENGSAEALPVAGDYAHLGGMQVLVVEDNKMNQLVVSKLLKKQGMLVTLADNGADALALYEERPFDLILMDIQMPVMDGYRATAEIRNHRDHAKREVPIIALTASAFLTKKEKAELFGMNDHVGKPFEPVELLEKISHCLALR